MFGSRTVQTFIFDGANMGSFLRWGNWFGRQADRGAVQHRVPQRRRLHVPGDERGGRSTRRAVVAGHSPSLGWSMQIAVVARGCRSCRCRSATCPRAGVSVTGRVRHPSARDDRIVLASARRSARPGACARPAARSGAAGPAQAAATLRTRSSQPSSTAIARGSWRRRWPAPANRLSSASPWACGELAGVGGRHALVVVAVHHEQRAGGEAAGGVGRAEAAERPAPVVERRREAR